MFAKIFNQIFDSSIAENPSVRRMFMDMLVLADRDGVVDMTHEAISRRINVDLKEVVECISCLEQTDPKSRSKDADGRRLLALDPNRTWGWRIVNWDKYRQSATQEMLRMAEAERKAEYRKRHGNNQSPPPVPPPSPSGTEGEAEADPSRTCPGQVHDSLGLPDEAKFWNLNCGTLPKVINISPSRNRHLKERRKDLFWVANFKQAVVRVSQTEFCLGQNDRGWRASFDFILQPDAVTKIMEGKYDGPPIQPSSFRGNGTKSIMEMRTILQAKETLANQIKERWSSNAAMGLNWSNEEKRKEYISIRNEIKELNSRIANMA